MTSSLHLKNKRIIFMCMCVHIHVYLYVCAFIYMCAHMKTQCVACSFSYGLCCAIHVKLYMLCVLILVRIWYAWESVMSVLLQVDVWVGLAFSMLLPSILLGLVKDPWRNSLLKAKKRFFICHYLFQMSWREEEKLTVGSVPVLDAV